MQKRVEIIFNILEQIMSSSSSANGKKGLIYEKKDDKKQ